MTPSQSALVFSSDSTFWQMFQAGGFIMIPLGICSLVVWAIIIERLWFFYKIQKSMGAFHLQGMNALLRKDKPALKSLIEKQSIVPSAQLMATALTRLNAEDARISKNWKEAVERKRQELGTELKKSLWILGTIGSAAPFIGLFGTVVGILKTFTDLARSGQGGFAVVAAGIAEALVATAAGIIVAVISVMAYNAFQTWVSRLVLNTRLQTEEWMELIEWQ